MITEFKDGDNGYGTMIDPSDELDVSVFFYKVSDTVTAEQIYDILGYDVVYWQSLIDTVKRTNSVHIYNMELSLVQYHKLIDIGMEFRVFMMFDWTHRLQIRVSDFPSLYEPFNMHQTVV